jgi:hypothetical protein
MNDLQNQPITGLVTSEGTVYGARYYCVEPIGGNWKDMEEWCTKSFGDAASVWDLKDTTYIWPELGRWYMNDRRFWFRNVKDRDWFIIRWNS